MKPPVLVGLVIAIVVVTGALFVPHLSPSAPARTDAHRLAELARRQAHLAGSHFGRLAALVDVAKLKEGDVDGLVERAAKRFEALPAEFSAAIRDATAKDARNNMPASIQAPGIGAGGIRKAIAEFAGQLTADEKLLADAEKNARAAIQADSGSMEAQTALGLVQLLKSSVLFAQSQSIRQQLEIRRAHMLMLGAQYRYAKGNIDHFSSLDVREAVTKLRADSDEVSGSASEAAGEVESMTRTIAARKTELEKAEADLAAARKDLEALEARGFSPGNDADFSTYRTQYLDVSARLRALQQKEELLRFGGTPDAEFDGGEVMAGEIKGGPAADALEELERRLEVAKVKADGFTQAKADMEKQISLIEVRGQTTGDAQKNVQGQLDKITEQLKKVQEDVGKLRGEAFDKESAALAAAQAAVSAFTASDRSAQTWKNAASALQGELDPERKNERLKTISNDQAVARIGQSGAAEAQLMAGHIHARRVDDLSRDLVAMERFSEMLPGSSFKTDTMEAAIKTARDEGQKALADAKATYERLIGGMGVIGWVPQASLALTHYLLGRIDNANADQHFRDAFDAIAKAVEKREQSPYLTAYVAFRDHLKNLAAARGMTLEEKKPEEKKDSEQPAEPENKP